MRMPFGKYRGTDVDELPEEYLTWLATIVLHEPLHSAVHRRLRELGPSGDPDDGDHGGVIALRTLKDRIEETFRRLAFNHHPDHGGSHQRMIAVNDCRDQLFRSFGWNA